MRVSRRLRSLEVQSDVGYWTFDTWYRYEYRGALAYAIALSGSREIAEDIVQDVFADASRRWDDITNHPNPTGWLRRAIANRAASRIRRLQVHRRVQHLLLRPDTVDPDLPSGEVWHAVSRLPHRQRQVVALHYLEDMPVAEIAEVLDVSAGSVKVHLSRGRDRLRKLLDVEVTE